MEYRYGEVYADFICSQHPRFDGPWHCPGCYWRMATGLYHRTISGYSWHGNRESTGPFHSCHEIVRGLLLRYPRFIMPNGERSGSNSPDSRKGE